MRSYRIRRVNMSSHRIGKVNMSSHRAERVELCVIHLQCAHSRMMGTVIRPREGREEM